MHVECERKVIEAFESRFWAKVAKAEPDACWLWTGHRLPKGYGVFRGAGGKVEKAHRVSYEIANGLIPPGLVVCHSCDNPPCVSPVHLRTGLDADNTQDREKKGRGVRLSGSMHGRATTTEADVIEMRRLEAEGVRRKDIAVQFGVGLSAVHQIISRHCWKHVP